MRPVVNTAGLFPCCPFDHQVVAVRAGDFLLDRLSPAHLCFCPPYQRRGVPAGGLAKQRFGNLPVSFSLAQVQFGAVIFTQGLIVYAHQNGNLLMGQAQSAGAFDHSAAFIGWLVSLLSNDWHFLEGNSVKLAEHSRTITQPSCL